MIKVAAKSLFGIQIVGRASLNIFQISTKICMKTKITFEITLKAKLFTYNQSMSGL